MLFHLPNMRERKIQKRMVISPFCHPPFVLNRMIIQQVVSFDIGCP